MLSSVVLFCLINKYKTGSKTRRKGSTSSDEYQYKVKLYLKTLLTRSLISKDKIDVIRTYCVVFKVPTLRKFLKMITSKLKSFVANYFLGNTILQKYLLTLVNNAKGLRIARLSTKKNLEL